MASSEIPMNSAGGSAFIRPTALERSMGRLMRSPEGHDAGAGDAGAGEAGAAAASGAEASALGGAGADAGAGGGDQAAGGEGSALGGAGEGAVEKTPEEIAAEAKATEEAAAAAKAAEIPEAYELTAPEGLTIDPKDIEAATPVFKDLGLTNEQANKLMPVAAAFAQRLVDDGNAKILAQVQADRKAWLDSAQADPEIGGAKWKESLAQGAHALDRLGFAKGSPFRVLLDESGLGNHPEMIRAWSKVGKAIGDDPTFLRGAGNPSAKRDVAASLYPNDVPKGGQ